MINLHPDAIIYVVSPAHIVTGGVEAIHQLVDKLRKFGHDARIFTVPLVSNPCLIQYRAYDVMFADTIVDSNRNLLITTEVNTGLLASFRSIQKALWWLSVDNHFSLPEPFDFRDPSHSGVIHLAQSTYAEQFLRRQEVGIIYKLTDYLNSEYLRPRRSVKSDLVLYTPVKGSEAFVDRLRAIDKTLHWKPLKGMIRKMHAQTLRQGKVYVDFGSHPGKDRQPREAAVNGCCVVVGLRGSACVNEDLPIPEGYKFDLSAFDAEAILRTIKACLLNHQACCADFVDYANIIRGEERQFEQEVIQFIGVRPSARPRTRAWTIVVNILCFWRQNSAFVAIRGLANEFVPIWLMASLKRQWRKGLPGRAIKA